MAVQHKISPESLSFMHTVRHPCTVCRRAFRYHYDGAYRHATLQPIDFICPRCFPEWFHIWEASHDWA